MSFATPVCSLLLASGWRPAVILGTTTGLVASLLLTLPTTGLAAAPTTRPATAAASAVSPAESRRAALERAGAAVVGVDVTAVSDARSTATLGRSRQGSGIVIGADGLVLTIGYLVLEADHVDLALANERRVPARVVAYDQATGFGLLQALAPLGIAPARLGVSATVGGDEPLLVASGGEDGELSLARLMTRRPFSGYWEYHIEDALFTAPARSDHSGAGLFNADGELVGVGSLRVADVGGGWRGSGNMFVPIDLLKPILAELRTRGASRLSTRAWLGLSCDEVGGEVRVLRPAPGSPAEAAGLERGDVIIAVDNVAVDALAAFYKTLWRDERAEREVTLDVRRGNALLRVKVQAVDRMKTLSRPQGT